MTRQTPREKAPQARPVKSENGLYVSYALERLRASTFELWASIGQLGDIAGGRA